MDPELRIWCFFITSENEDRTGGLFQIPMPSQDTVFTLKMNFGQRQLMQPSKADKLTVWRCKQPALLTDAEDEELPAIAKRVFIDKQVKKLNVRTKLSELDLVEEEILLVKVLQTSGVGEPIDRKGKFFEKYGNAFIRILQSSRFTMGDETLNNILQWPNGSDDSVAFVEKLKTALAGKRKFDDSVLESLKEVTSFREGSYHFAMKSSRPSAIEIEVLHIWNELRKGIQHSISNLEVATNSKIFYPLSEYIAFHDPDRLTCRFGANPWPWKLVLQVYKDGKGGDAYSYGPVSNISGWKYNFPCFLGEVFSKGGQDDHARLFVQGASCVRLANLLLPEQGKPAEFVLPLIYIDQDFNVSRYLFFQTGQAEGRKPAAVYYTKKMFRLDSKKDHYSFLCELYNLADWLLDNQNNILLPNEGPTEFMSSVSQHLRPMPTKSGTQQEGNNTRSQGGDGAPITDFNEAGYQIAPVSSFTTSCKLAEIVYRLRQIGDVSRRTYVVKRLRRHSHEAEIFQHLKTIGHPCEHIIELIDIISPKAGVERWTVLPERQLIADQLYDTSKDGVLRGRSVELSRDLAKGVNFLHENGIAHLDIKPENLVYTESYRLQIIDFDVSVRVRDEDEVICNRIGTDEYMAPEIGPEGGWNGLPTFYSPIRADRYSCGVVMKEFAEVHEGDDEGLAEFAFRLMDDVPEKRPRLLEWCQSTVGMKDDASDRSIHSEAETLLAEATDNNLSGRPHKRLRMDS